MSSFDSYPSLNSSHRVPSSPANEMLNRYLEPVANPSEQVARPSSEQREVQASREFYTAMETLFLDAAYGKAHCEYLRTYEKGDKNIVINVIITAVAIAAIIFGGTAVTVIASIVLVVSLIALAFFTHTRRNTQEICSLEPVFDAILNANYNLAYNLLNDPEKCSKALVEQNQTVSSFSCPNDYSSYASVLYILSQIGNKPNNSSRVSAVERYIPTMPLTADLRTALLEKHFYLHTRNIVAHTEKNWQNSFKKYYAIAHQHTFAPFSEITQATLQAMHKDTLTQERMGVLQTRINNGLASSSRLGYQKT